ncbi:MAG TPA: PAS domain S-box protein [Verrucomicrobiae bacterium]|nr:PAS domain S-box protein [Verrucomicrobiae bacterium]
MKTFNRLLQILLVEDSENDALLIELALQRSGAPCRCRRVETAEEMAAALQTQNWDAIIADYVLPKFDGLAALALIKERGVDVPFIVVSGHITEDTAVAAMKAGAHDYVMKDKLTRLVPAITREMREAEMRRARRAFEKELREEQSFRAAIETSIPSGIAVVDLDGRQSYVNPAFCEMVGWHEAELIGRKPPFDFWPEEEREHITGVLARVVEGNAPAGGLELRLRRKNGDRFDALVLVTALKDPFENITGWLSSFTDITQRKEAEDALRRSHEQLEERVRQRTSELSKANSQLQAAMKERRRLEHELLEITDKERRSIGLNLHDDLGQKLTGIALMCKGLQVQLDRRNAEGAAEAGRIHALIQETMKQTRNISHDLITSEFQEQDLASAMEGMVARVQRTFNVACRFHCETAAPEFESNAVSQLYKITQEAVTNAVKHGKAKNVEIRLAKGGNQFHLSIHNDGAPFPSVVNKNGGLGLRIMSYRAHLIGGSLDVKPGESEGAIVTCSLPCPEGYIGAGTARSTTPLEMA